MSRRKDESLPLFAEVTVFELSFARILGEESAVKRYHDLLELKEITQNRVNSVYHAAYRAKESTCSWSGMGISSGAIAIWMCIEPVTGVLASLSFFLSAMSPVALAAGQILKLTKHGEAELRAAKRMEKQINLLATKIDGALIHIEENHTSELAASSDRNFFAKTSPRLAELFEKAAAQKSQLSLPPASLPQIKGQKKNRPSS